MAIIEQLPPYHADLRGFHYFTQRENVLILIVVDLTFGSDKADPPLDWCTIVKVNLRDPSNAGLTKAAEEEMLGQLEEALEDAANGVHASLLDKLLRRSTTLKVRNVGRETAGGVQKIYFYGTGPIPDVVFKRVMAMPEFDNQQWSRQVATAIEKDDALSFYTSNLHPGAALNPLILTQAQLEMRTDREYGDDLDPEAAVTHELSFPDAESRQRFVTSFVDISKGDPVPWEINFAPDPAGEEPGAFRVRLTREQEVDKLIEIYVTALSARAESFGGKYEGWTSLQSRGIPSLPQREERSPCRESRQREQRMGRRVVADLTRQHLPQRRPHLESMSAAAAGDPDIGHRGMAIDDEVAVRTLS